MTCNWVAAGLVILILISSFYKNVDRNRADIQLRVLTEYTENVVYQVWTNFQTTKVLRITEGFM